MNDVAAIVLCGGASRRMGRDKAWLPFGNETMLQRAVRIVVEVCDPVVVVAAPHQALPELPSAVLIARDPCEYAGPVAALRSGMESIPPDRPVFVCGCDMPFVSAELIRLIAMHFRSGHVVVPCVGGVRQPLGAIYPHEVRALASLSLSSPREIFGHLPIVEVHESDLRKADPEFRAFMRINDLECYNEALAIWKARRKT